MNPCFRFDSNAVSSIRAMFRSMPAGDSSERSRRVQCEEESMSVRPVWLRFMPENHCTAIIFSCLMLMMSLSIGDALGQDSLSMNGALQVDEFGSSRALATEDALRERVAREGWVRVRVDLIQSAKLSVPSDAVEAGILEDQSERTTQDLLFALPAGSYEAVHRDADSPTLTLRVDAVGLDELLVSPLVVNVGAAGIPGEAGMDLAMVVEQAIRSYQLAYAISPDVEAAAYGDSLSDNFVDISSLEDLRAEIIATLEQLDTGSVEARDHLRVALQNLDDTLATDAAESLSALPSTADAVDYRVEFIPSSYSFGQVPVGSSSAPQTATIRNTGTGTVTFERGILNSPYVSAGYSISDSTCGATLSPGASCEFKIRFQPQASGSRSGYLFVSADESVELYFAQLSGTGTADRTYSVAFIPSSYSFGQVPVGSSSAPQTATIRNTGTGTVTFERGILNSPYVSAGYSISDGTCGATLSPGASCELKIKVPTAGERQPQRVFVCQRR